MSSQPDVTVFDIVMNRLAEAGIACLPDDDGKVQGAYACYTFADGADLTWATISNTGMENSLHSVSEHGVISGHCEADRAETRGFGSGDVDKDVSAFVAWVVDLADRHGKTSE